MTTLDAEHETFAERAYSGEILVGIDRPFARRFYTDISLHVIKQETGEAPYFAKFFVLSAWVSAPLLLLLAAGLTILVLGWWATVVIPLGLLAWLRYYSNSSYGTVRIRGISILLASMILAATIDPLGQRETLIVAVAYILAMWVGRFVYAAATVFLRAFVIRNARAFNWLRSELVVRKP